MKRLLLCASLLLAMPAFADIHSKYIRIDHGGLATDDQGGPLLVQAIQNTAGRPLWVTVRQGEGPSACEVTRKIEPAAGAVFKCANVELKPGDVPVAIDIFGDEARTEKIESLRDEMHFTREEVRAFQEILQARKLPVTYEGIYYAEKLGIGSLFRQMVPHADGKLSISATQLEYVDGKQTITIPASKLRKVGFGGPSANGQVPWIVVTVQEGDATKNIGFHALSHPEQTGRIAVSINTMLQSRKEGAENVPGETLGDANLSRDTARTILEAEKAAAPDCASPKITDTKVVEKLNAEVKDGRPVRGDWAERWVVDRCGKEVAYAVKYTIDPKGGTKLAITPPK